MDNNLNPERKIVPLDTGTELAFERTYLAYERTQMAWVRTGLSLISFGFTISKFFEFLHEKSAVQSPLLSARMVGVFMIGFGIVALVLADIQHAQAVRRLREKCHGLPISLSRLVSAILTVLGILALIGALLK